jgi:CDP-L-myo-inositol myo-inositolphosphotransferase
LPHIILTFGSAATAEYRVAGIPAAARAAHAVGLLRDHGVDCGTIDAGPGWTPGAATIAECARLAPQLRLAFGRDATIPDALMVDGAAFVAALAERPGRPEAVLPALFACVDRAPWNGDAAPERDRAALRALRRAGDRIIASTGKGGDGIVSRYINRPISQAISRRLLRIPGLRPAHASAGTALLGIAMAAALFLGGATGLIVGGLLFQAASIFDGVDGEMARATWRTSNAGATLDSVIDACTNLAFLTGVTVNVWLAGDTSAATAGAVALATLTTGLLLIGRRAKAGGEPMNFDGVKCHFRRKGRRSLLMEGLIHLTMRDFFAAACAVLLVLGLSHWLLFAFATVALGWFAVTVAVLARQGRPRTAAATEQEPAAGEAFERRGAISR